METPELSSSDLKFQARLGLEPQMMENLLESQRRLAQRGIKKTLEQVYALEVEQVEQD